MLVLGPGELFEGDAYLLLQRCGERRLKKKAKKPKRTYLTGLASPIPALEGTGGVRLGEEVLCVECWVCGMGEVPLLTYVSRLMFFFGGVAVREFPVALLGTGERVAPWRRVVDATFPAEPVLEKCKN